MTKASGGHGPATAATDVVAMLLAGFLSDARASGQLGLDDGDLKILLEEVNLAGVAMVPAGVDDDLDTHYLDIGRSKFAAPLFDDVVDEYRRAHRSTATVRLRLPAADVLTTAASPPRASPRGLIFHVGRCGSTLLCNLLTSADGWVALKEPEFINTVLLRLAAEHDTVSRARLGALIALLLRSLAHGVRIDADGRERACLVKFTSWNLLLAEELTTRLDGTPLIVLTRDPWATVASLLHDPPHWYGLSSSWNKPSPAARARRVEAAGMFAEAWCQTVEQSLRLPSERTLLLSYDDLIHRPLVMLGQVFRHLGDDQTSLSTHRIDDVMGRYSKGTGTERFQPRARHFRDTLDSELRDLVTTITTAAWADLVERTRSARAQALGP